MHVIQRADGPNCQHCAANEETLTHKFSECARVAAAWAHTQRRLTAIVGGRQQFSFGELFRPVLNGIADEERAKLLKNFINYIVFVDNCSTTAIDVAALDFELSLIRS
uniref:(northern house mosquito) hypothetical protein n=1 Tax=Culex pipiens TaxID=7175 RepID=A0A8D8NB04_CULPI